MAHDHNHDHEERELITLVDEQGNETLFEILLTIDGKEEFGKNYVLLIPANAEEDENGEVEIQAYSFTENEDGTEGDLQPIPEDSDAAVSYTHLDVYKRQDYRQWGRNCAR